MNIAEPRQRAWRLTSPKAHTLAPPLERAEQAVVMDWADRESGKFPELRMLFAVPNGEKRSEPTAALLKRQGVKPGVPDLLLPIARAGFIGLAIEMKRKPNKPTDLQQAWLDNLMSHGWFAVVCYSAAEAIEVLRKYVSARPTIIGPARVVRE